MITASYLSHWAVRDGKLGISNSRTWPRTSNPVGHPLPGFGFPVGRKLARVPEAPEARAGVPGSRSHFSAGKTETAEGYYLPAHGRRSPGSTHLRRPNEIIQVRQL